MKQDGLSPDQGSDRQELWPADFNADLDLRLRERCFFFFSIPRCILVLKLYI